MRTQRADGCGATRASRRPAFRECSNLRYHGYSAYFPAWALAAYRTLTRRGSLIEWGGRRRGARRGGTHPGAAVRRTTVCFS